MRFHIAFLIIAILTITGCGRATLIRDPQFDPYVARFIQHGIDYHYGVENWERISITLNPYVGNIVEGAIGICHSYDDLEAKDRGEANAVEVLTSWWIAASDIEREEVVFHELGHCLLDRDHDNRTEGWVPLSLMNEYEVGGWLYDRYRDGYIHELFAPGWRFL